MMLVQLLTSSIKYMLADITPSMRHTIAFYGHHVVYWRASSNVFSVYYKQTLLGIHMKISDLCCKFCNFSLYFHSMSPDAKLHSRILNYAWVIYCRRHLWFCTLTKTCDHYFINCYYCYINYHYKFANTTKVKTLIVMIIVMIIL